MSAMAVAMPAIRSSGASNKPTRVFDPDDRSTVRHTKAGVWDIYEDISGSSRRNLFQLPFLSKIKAVMEAYKGYKHVTRMIHDIVTVEDCWMYFTAWVMLRVLAAFMPAATLWYTGQLLRMVETAVETRTVDKDALLRVAALRIVMPFLRHALRDCIGILSEAIHKRIEAFYTFRAFRTASKLDVPTFADKEVQQSFYSLSSRGGYSHMTWYMFTSIMDIFSGVIYVASQVMVLISVFRDSPEALFLAAISMAQIFVDQISSHARMYRKRDTGVHAWKTSNDDYVLNKGLRSMASKEIYRKDIVAGGLGETLYKEFKRTLLSLGENDVDAFNSVMAQKKRWMAKLGDYLRDPVEALGQVYTCLRVVNSPSAAPFTLATLQLVNSTMASLTQTAYVLGSNIDHISDQVERIRSFYAILDLQNKIQDGIIPFPENQRDIAMGISVEFRNVSFRYDQILVDVRKAIAVLFQEYSIFPMSLARNIGYGDPEQHTNMDNVRRAAELGGAGEFIEALPYQYDTYVERPVHDWGGGEPKDGSIFAGKNVDFSMLNLNAQQKGLSGGQKQRIALSRTFMKSLVSVESNVGLLLFDEPSASLDPKAEHDLFTRLRELRGSKTMVFSTHRFGKLTRHADLILYIHQGEVLEAGSHVELMKKPEGEYAKFWNLQAQDFI
ncbi:hypothetical protein NMY22_g1463 [Coprinellus aureogranulatus]|nr:hypothetical protein NMY22_g1463 [Coprinellus aureogranulatus]